MKFKYNKGEITLKKLLTAILMTATLITLNIPLKAQENNRYKWINPKPQGSELQWVKMWDANNWYAVGAGTTFMKTSNAGATWTVYDNIYLSDNYATEYLRDAIFLNMNTGIACGSNGKIIKTTNGGVNWTVSVVAEDTTALWYSLYFLDQNTGFVAGSRNWIGKTTDGGTTWNGISLPNLNTHRAICAKDENNILVGYVNGLVRKTTDGGMNWTSPSPGGTGYFNCLKIAGGDTVYTASNQVFMSTDFGATWTSVTGTLPSVNYYDIDIVTNGGTKYVYVTGNDSLIYRSQVGTSSWTPVSFLGASSIGNDYSFNSSDYSITGDTILTVGEYGIINIRYSPSNKSLLTSYMRPPGYYLTDIWAESTNGRVITVGDQSFVNPGGDHNQIMYSTNGGMNWQVSNIPMAIGTRILSLSMINSMTGYAGSDGSEVLKTTDGGVNWEETPSQPLSVRGNGIENVFFTNEDTGYVFGEVANVKTTNGGANWSDYAPGQSFNYIYSSYFVNGTTGWTTGENGEIFKTTNGGANVTQQNSQTGSTLEDIFMLDANTGWTIGYGTVRKTTNGGTDWDTVNIPFQVELYSVNFIDQMNGLIVGESGIALRTSDGGMTWDYGNTTADESNSGVWMTETGIAFICGLGGEIFQYRETVTGTELTYTNEVPPEYQLEQNYPNPFNPSTTIKFALPRQGTVSLKIYDIAGREVASLFDNAKLNQGTFEQRFDGSGLASGVYFYTLQMDGFVETKKMMLVK